jgi:hypothetical protein
MTEQTIRDIHRAEVIRQWVAATNAAISALQGWRNTLIWWEIGVKIGANSSNPETRFDLAMTELDDAGLLDWADWCPAAGGLDALAEALGVPPTVDVTTPE